MSNGIITGAEYDLIYKIVVVGDSSVGKSNLLLRFTRNEFRLDTQATIGVEFAYKQLTIDGKKVKTQVWDTAGQERFKTIIPQFYRGCVGALVVFDLTKPNTFEHVQTWVNEVNCHGPQNAPIVLVGNKSDLVSGRAVTPNQAMSLAERLNLSYIETSALNASNVEEAFHLLVKTIYEKEKPKMMSSSQVSPIDQTETLRKPVQSDPTIKLEESVTLTPNKADSSQKKKACCVIS